MAESEWIEDPIETIYIPVISGWNDRTTRKPDVLPGCALFDERDSQTVELSWTAIVAAVDSLAVLVKLHEHETREVHEIATHAIARGPILAACTAFWLLDSDESRERVSRGLCLLEWNMFNLEQFSRPLLDEEDEDTKVVIDGLSSSNDFIRDYRQVHGLDSRKKPSDTKIIDYSARRIETLAPCSHRQVMGLWRLCSGQAHAMRWAAKMPRPDNPYMLMTNLIGTGVELTNAALDLWDERTRVQN